MRTTVFLALPLVFVTVSLAQNARRSSQSQSASAHLPPAAIGALQKIDPEHIRANVRFLSHDLLEGRGTGQRGGDIAAEYIATQFLFDGLKPAGDNGTFFQNVPMVGITPATETTFELAPRHGEAMQLKPLDEYVAYDQDRKSTRLNSSHVEISYA